MTNALILLVLFTSGLLATGCSKDKDILLEAIVEEEPINNFDPEKIILIPSDFNWAAIPEGHKDMVWEIRDDFDLEGQEVTLPENVVLHFIDGVMTNGILVGNETTIASSATGALFQEVELSGNFTNEFVKPQWFGAVMDGVTDDRDAFVRTLAQSLKINAKVLVDKDMFLDVEETGKKSIFLEDNTWIEGANNANIIINNLLSPAFILALTKNITIQDVNFLYDNSYDAGFGWDINSINANNDQLKNYLKIKKQIIFDAQNPVWRGPVSFRYTFLIDAAQDVTFQNVVLKSKGATANEFMIGAVKLKEEYTTNQTVTNSLASTDIPRNIRFQNVTLDGVIMGIQGTVDGFKSENLKSYRYSDVQTLNGQNIGGNDGSNTYWMPPPHLLYFNHDNSTIYTSQNIEILNTTDFGLYVGSADVRATESGYCNSLKLVDGIKNIEVDGYQSYRRDGLGDLGNITNGVFKNIVSESKSEIFNPDFGFLSLRFVGALNNCVFQNMTIKDLSENSLSYPMRTLNGDYITMDNVLVSLNNLASTKQGSFGINGSNNVIKNSTLEIKNHISDQTYISVINHNEETRNSGKNNNYEIQVKGWRSIEENPKGRSIRMLFAGSSNTNTNYAKVVDVTNDYVIEQTNNVEKDIWKRTEVVALGSGTSQPLTMTIPAGYTVKSINTSILENLVAGIQISLGTDTSQKTNLLDAVSSSIGTKLNTINEAIAQNGTRTIYFFSNKDFDNKGKIEVILELERISSYD